MKYFLLFGEINDDLMYRFVDFYNQGHEKVTIVLDSVGGLQSCADTITRMINNMPDATLLIHVAYSAGLQIAYNTNCKKVLGRECCGMYHYGCRKLDISDSGRADGQGHYFVQKQLPLYKSNREKWAKQFMTDKELKDMIKGNDVFFNLERMQQIIPDAEMIL